MSTLDIIRQLRDWAAVEGPGSRTSILIAAADRLEELDERLDIMDISLREMDERLGEMRL